MSSHNSLTHVKSGALTTSLKSVLQNRLAERGRCLLLDISGSMAGWKWDRLCEIARDFPTLRKFAFSDSCEEVSEIPRVRGGTALAGALHTIKLTNVSHAVLITDGQPTDGKDRCIEEARGLRLDIFYVGPEGDTEAQDFLRRLAAGTGGHYGKADISQTKELASGIKALLEAATK